MNRIIAITVIGASLLGLVGCGSLYLKTGRAYHQRGNLPVAIEYYDQGLLKEPANEEMRDELIVADQTYQWQLRDQVDRLKEGDSYLMAVATLYELLERTKRMTALKLPTELPQDIESELRQITGKATTQLSEDLDQRSGRSQVLVSDLQACRQIQALELEDDFINRRCTKLLAQLKLVASAVVAADSHPLGRQVVNQMSQNIIAQNPVLIGFAQANAADHNAKMVVKVGPYYSLDTGWYLSKRDAYHTWVHKLDKKGRPITRQITTPPDPKEVKKAEKDGNEAPEAKIETKHVWIQVRGDYHFYEYTRTLYMPYQVTLIDLRDNTQVVAFEGLTSGKSVSKYYNYAGHPRGRKNIRNRGSRGKHNAVPVASPVSLAQQAANKIATPVANAVLKRIE